MPRILFSVVLFTFLFAGGCATIARGGRQDMKFETDPPGATVEVDGQKYTSPTTVPVVRKGTHKIVISMAGYQSVTFDLKGKWDAVVLGNLIYPGGSIGLLVDMVSGADRKFDELAQIKLTKTENPDAPPLELVNEKGKLVPKQEVTAADAGEK